MHVACPRQVLCSPVRLRPSNLPARRRFSSQFKFVRRAARKPKHAKPRQHNCSSPGIPTPPLHSLPPARRSHLFRLTKPFPHNRVKIQSANTGRSAVCVNSKRVPAVQPTRASLCANASPRHLCDVGVVVVAKTNRFASRGRRAVERIKAPRTVSSFSAENELCSALGPQFPLQVPMQIASDQTQSKLFGAKCSIV